VDRRVKLTLAARVRPRAPLACQGRCVSPTSATDLQNAHPLDRSTLESPEAAAFAADSSFHAARPVNPWQERDRVEPA